MWKYIILGSLIATSALAEEKIDPLVVQVVQEAQANRIALGHLEQAIQALIEENKKLREELAKKGK